MVKLDWSPEELFIYEIRGVVHVRVPVAGEADLAWRQIYNDLADKLGIDAEARGHGDRAVLIVRYPAGQNQVDVERHLAAATGSFRGEILDRVNELHDERRQARSSEDRMVDRWWRRKTERQPKPEI
jgi:hypothetical protein